MSRIKLRWLVLAGVVVVLLVLRATLSNERQSIVDSPLVSPPTLTERADRLQTMQAAATATRELDSGKFTSGPTTLGSEIYVTGRKLPLPADVYVVAVLSDILCTSAEKCPRTPYYGLAYADDETVWIGIEGPTGKIWDDSNATPDIVRRNRIRFAWLYDALGQERPVQ